MGSSKTSSLLGALMGAVSVAAHGHVQHIIVNGVQYPGYDPTTHPYMSDPPVVVGWAADQLDNGFVSPDAYTTPDMICHRSATNAKGHAQVAAGDSITLQWTAWPESHHGPVIDWLAPCNGDCETVDKTSLRFFKIDGLGLVTPGSPGYYAADVLIDKGNTWTLKIPSNIKPGNYVLRHEIIALHGAGSANGAQSYPQCFNLEITGSGTDSPAGVPGTALYPANDPGVLVNIYDASLNYQVPGGAIIAGGQSSAVQNPTAATATGVPTQGSSGGSGGGGGSVTTTTAQNPPQTTQAPTPTSTSGGGSGSGGGQSLYGQCGGNGWTGPTTCVSGATCQFVNEWYSQCVPA